MNTDRESSLFLSSPSSDLAGVRERLAEHLRPAGYKVVHQKELVETGENTLIKLAESIRHESTIVLHILGASSGSVPPGDDVNELLRHCGENDLRERFPKLFADEAYRRLTYTQWEAWLGLYYAKRVCVFTIDSSENVDTAAGQAGLPREDHLALLKPLCGYATACADEVDLRDNVKTTLLRLKNRLPGGDSIARRPVKLPYGPIGELFKGREEFLETLRESLCRGSEGSATAITGRAVHGLGGVGKTRLAVEYAWQHAEEYSAVLFVTADSEENLRRNLADLVGPLVLNLAEQSVTEEEARVAAALRWLGEHPGWFLILDNVDTEEAAECVEQLLPRLQRGQVLITSRLARWRGQVQPLELDVLEADAAAEFLLQKTEPQGGRGRKVTENDADDAAELAGDLDGLALALEQAGAYIVARRKSLSEYIKLWRQHDAEVQTWHSPREMQYPRSVAVTWQTTLDQLGDDERTLMNLLAWFDAEPVPLSVFAPSALTDALSFKTETAGKWTAERVEAALANLSDYSMLRWEPQTSSVHRVVQEILRSRQDEPKQWLTAALRLLDQALPDGDPDDVRTWPAWEPLRPHVAFAVGEADRRGVAEPTSGLMGQLGTLLWAKPCTARPNSWSAARWPLMRKNMVLIHGRWRCASTTWLKRCGPRTVWRRPSR